MIIEHEEKLDEEIQIDEIGNKILNLTNNIIDSKRLQLNYIWSNKITQEDLNTPKILEDSAQNSQIVNQLFISIIKYASKINEIFETILYSSEFNQESVFDLIFISSALIQKFKNFFQIKNKQFKKEKYLIEPLTKLSRYYGLFKINIKKEEISKKVDEFHNLISEFNQMLETDGHLK
jgi:hypothetical protein